MSEKFNLVDFDNLPIVAGIYTWHIRHTANISNESFYKLLRYKKLNAEVKGVFNEQYKGEVRLSDKYKNITSVNNLKGNLLYDLSESISSPIYIGISENLHKRLNKHKAQMETALFSKYPPDDLIRIEASSLDTDKESAYMAGRICSALRELEVEDINILYARINILPGVGSKDLKIIERYFNECYMPVFGRK
jgi:predicted GIY-YIG superfamily endonuclease